MINKHIKEKCPVCDSQDYKYKKKHQGLDLGYCESCSLAYARPLIRGESDDVGDSNSTITEADFYEGLKKNHTLQSQIAIKKAPIMLEYWQRILAENTGRELSILEIGCGTGQYYDAWKNLNVHWTGLEVNKDMLNFCKEKNIPVIDTNIMETKLDRQYDVVFLSQVLEHIIDPNLFIKKIHENMSENGILHIDVPNHSALSSLYRKLNPLHPEYGFLQPNHHLIAYNKKALGVLLGNNGFDMVHIAAHSNDDNLFGQLITTKSILNKIVFWLSNIIGKGSLLVAVAKRTT